MITAAGNVTADFLERDGRGLFYLLFEPRERAVRGSLLFLPPFAEEMNKSRHTVACQARAFANAGYRVMLLDLTGCGDAEGDFADSSWQVWKQDAACALDKLAGMGNGRVSVWGLRLGGLLACELAHNRSEIESVFLWQPVLNGEQQIDQFLRLRTVASAVDGSTTFDRKALWSELRAGRSLEIAGYELSPALALEMARSRLNDMHPRAPVHWLEIGLSPQAGFSVASETAMARWREQGVRVQSDLVQGEPFWRIVDAQVNHALINATLDCLAR